MGVLGFMDGFYVLMKFANIWANTSVSISDSVYCKAGVSYLSGKSFVP